MGGSGRLEKVGGTRGLAPFNRVGVRRKRSRVRPCRTTPRRAAGQLDWLMVMADRSRVPQPTNQRARAIVSSETATLPSAHRPLAPRSWVCAFVFYSIFLVLRRYLLVFVVQHFCERGWAIKLDETGRARYITACTCQWI